MNLELTLCQKIKKAQKEKKISNSEAAKAIGIDPVNYSRKMSNNLMKAEEIEATGKLNGRIIMTGRRILYGRTL